MPTFVLENSFQFARVKLIHPEELSNLNLIKTPDFFTHFRCILYCAGAENDVFAGKSISFPEAAILLVSDGDRDLWR